MISALVVVIGLSLLILVHELGHFLAAKYCGVKVEEFGIGFPPRLVSKKIGETRYSFNWLPVGGFVKLHGEFSSPDTASPEGSGGDRHSFINQKVGRRALILVSGVIFNFLAGWWLLTLVFFIGSPQFVLVARVVPESPAAEAGIMAGDRIVGFGKEQEVTNFIQRHRRQPITLRIERRADDGTVRLLEIEAIPQETLGIAIIDVGFAPQPFLTSVKTGLGAAVGIVGGITAALGSIVAAPQEFVGPVGIFTIAAETGKLGLAYLLQLLALISLNLTVLNLLPIPALDGGRLLFLIIEKIKGSALNRQRELLWNSVGFVFIIGLIIFITIQDISRLL